MPALVFVAPCGISLVVASEASLQLWCMNFLLLRLLLLWSTGSRACGLSSCGVWGPPWPAIEPLSPALLGKFLTTGPPGKPRKSFLNYNFLSFCRGFPCRSAGKESACSAGDLGSIPGFGRSPREGNGNPLQNPCLENLMDRGLQSMGLQRVGHDWAINTSFCSGRISPCSQWR